ncbi:MAG: GntR family transcriptional regulator [Candidatus Micrarchaeaceae archaeon]
MESVIIQPISQKVADEVRKAIFTGELKAGQVLSQEEIAQKLGVSRIPVREAFSELEKTGLLVLRNNRRAVVADLTVEDFTDHYSIRIILEGEAAARASLTNGHKEIEDAYEELKNASKNQDIPAYVVANEKFHKEIWEASGSKYLILLLNQLWKGLPPYLPELLPEQIKLSSPEHEAILNAILNRQPEDARRFMQKHIERSQKSFIQRYMQINTKT